MKRSVVRPAVIVLATHGFFKPDEEVKKDDKAVGSLASAGPGSRGATRAVTTTGEPLEDPLLRCGLALANANVGAKAQGQLHSKALREAQLTFIKFRREDRDNEAAHPHLWSAYGVTGL